MKPAAETPAALARFHLLVAWWSLLAFILLGATLEGLHAWKVSDYLGRAAETRRLMWTLSHAHGTLIALVHGLYAFTLSAFTPVVATRHRWASALLVGAGVLIPVGFFLGGMFVFDGDPGAGVWLVPVGAFALVAATLVVGLDLKRGPR